MVTALSREHSTMTLGLLLEGLLRLPAAQDVAITSIALDSRQVRPGCLFVALPGARAHGIEFVSEVVRAGAAAVVFEADAALTSMASQEIPVISVPQLGAHLGWLADRFYHHPSARLPVIGVTGTNGKTSISHYVAQALARSGARPGIIGTLGSGFGGELQPAVNTTPDALALHDRLAGFAHQGATHAVMEVSSHGLDQGRVNGVRFHTAVYTNLSRDHLDYHPDLRSYGETKARLFRWPGLQGAVINHDDEFGRSLLEGCSAAKTICYTLEARPSRPGKGSGWLLGEWTPGLLRVDGDFGRGDIATTLVGRFNAANLLGTLGTLLSLEVPFEKALALILHTQAVPGRMERIDAPGFPQVIIDYAHTPDALDAALRAVGESGRRIWVVFGCGGDRDRGKRPEMGAIAERLAYRVILTDDNPRNEEGALIIRDIQAGMRFPDTAMVERDRAEAIALALRESLPGDCVLVAGKGHEQYQIVGDRKLPFDDRAVVAELLQRGRP